MLLPVQEEKIHHSVNLFYFIILREQIYQQNSILQVHCIYRIHSVALREMSDGGDSWHALSFLHSTHHVHRADIKVPTETWGN